jgi:hypothetical protein
MREVAFWLGIASAVLLAVSMYISMFLPSQVVASELALRDLSQAQAALLR